MVCRHRLFFHRRLSSGSRRPLPRRLRRPSLARGRCETPSPTTPMRPREGRPGWRWSGGDEQQQQLELLPASGPALLAAASATREHRHRCHGVEAGSNATYRRAHVDVRARAQERERREVEKRVRESEFFFSSPLSRLSDVELVFSLTFFSSVKQEAWSAKAWPLLLSPSYSHAEPRAP